MALHYIYSDAPGSTIDITARCRTYVLSVKDQAEEGAVAISSLTIDDPDGDLVITGHRRLYIYEDTAPAGNQIIFNGFTVNERLIRGPSGRTGASRQWVVDLADVNVLINRRIMNGADANRPAETDLARIQALLTMTELNTVDDDSLVSTTAGTVDMDAVDYRGQNVGQYIDDCRQQSGKNAYIYYNETLGEYGLWYDFASSSAYDSNCFLTNTIGEANGATVFNYSLEQTYLNVDPSRVASGIYLPYDGGIVYAQDPNTTDEFAAIDWGAPSENVKTAPKAIVRANRYLRDAATEHPIIHVVTTNLPRASVNAIKKGQLVQFKSSYMDNFTDYTTCRVMYRTVSEISEDPSQSFEIEMDLDPIPPQCPSPTPTGSFYPLGGSGNTPNVSTTGNVLYLRAGISNPIVVSPGHQGSWHFPTYGAGGVGTVDYWGGCTQSFLRLVVVGDGQMTIHTSDFLSVNRPLDARLWHADGVARILDASTIVAAGTDIVFDISSHGQEFCTHWVDVRDTGGQCGSGGGFNGMDWVQA